MLHLVTHQSEKDIEGDLHFQQNKKHFSEQLIKVLRVLMRGQELTAQDAAQYYGVFSLSSRCSELKRAGITIQKNWVGEKPKVRTYYLTPTEIDRIKSLKIA